MMRWGILGLLGMVVASVAASLYFLATRPAGVVYSYPFFGFGWFFGLFWIFIIFMAVRWLFWPWRWHYPHRYWRYGDNSYYILRERYAKGEITKEQYDQMMRDLQQHETS